MQWAIHMQWKRLVPKISLKPGHRAPALLAPPYQSTFQEAILINIQKTWQARREKALVTGNLEGGIDSCKI